MDDAKNKKPTYRKYCMVPECSNNNINSPDKLFFCVPREEKIRKQWCKRMKKDNVSPLSCLYCCEEHFNVEEDTANYIEYKIKKDHGQKCSLRLKKGVVPHKFLCQKESVELIEKKRVIKRQRIALLNEAPSAFEKKMTPLKQAQSDNYMEKQCVAETGVHGVKVKTEPADEAMNMTALKQAQSDVYMEEQCVAETAVHGVEVKIEATPKAMCPELPMIEDEAVEQVGWALDADPRFALHEEVMLPSYPPDIKEELEFEEGSQSKQAEDYVKIITRIKEEMAELRSENQRLTDENKRLSEKNRNLTSRIEELQKSDRVMGNYRTIRVSNITTLKKFGSEALKEENRRLIKAKDMLKKVNKKQANTILELSGKNQNLSEELKQKLKEATKSRKNARLMELHQKILTLNEEIDGLKYNNRNLTEEINGLKLKNKKVMGQIEVVSKEGRKPANFKELVEIRCLTEEKYELAEQVRELTERVRELTEEKGSKNKLKRKPV